MNNTTTIITTEIQKIKKLVPVAQVVELGKASALTLGQDGWGTETPTRPDGLFKK